jgi:Cu/Ag efflux pump CusA
MWPLQRDQNAVEHQSAANVDGIANFRVQPIGDKLTSLGVTENDLPNCQRATNSSAAAGTAMAKPTHRVVVQGPGRKTTTEITVSTAYSWKTKNAVKPFTFISATSRDPAGRRG